VNKPTTTRANTKSTKHTKATKNTREFWTDEVFFVPFVIFVFFVFFVSRFFSQEMTKTLHRPDTGVKLARPLYAIVTGRGDGMSPVRHHKGLGHAHCFDFGDSGWRPRKRLVLAARGSGHRTAVRVGASPVGAG
jgi:hypothetical protein